MASANLVNLPVEIILMIFGYLIRHDYKTLSSLALSCKTLSPVAQKLLHDHIEVVTHDVARLLAGQVVRDRSPPALVSLLRACEDISQPDGPPKRVHLLDMSYDEEFYEHATDPDYLSRLLELKDEGSRMPVTRTKRGMLPSAILKAQIVLLLPKVYFLAIDLQDVEKFFKCLREKISLTLTEITSAGSKGRFQSLIGAHWASLQTLEIRQTRVLGRGLDTQHAGTVCIEGSWTHFPTLRVIKIHGDTIPESMQDLFTMPPTASPTSLTFNDFRCDGTHQVVMMWFSPQRLETIENLTFRNLQPCGGFLRQVKFLILATAKSLKHLSVTRRRLCEDLPRYREAFTIGYLTSGKMMQSLTELEYLDIDSRFLIKEKELDKEKTVQEWLSLPESLQTLSIDAITSQEVQYVQEFLQILHDHLKSRAGLSNLKSIRCGFMTMDNQKRVNPDLELKNFPGRFMALGVSLKGWEYDFKAQEDEVEEEPESIAARVRARRRLARRVS